MADALEDICSVCSKPASLKCSDCLSVVYCGQQHQRADWPKHRESCRAYKVKINPLNGVRYIIASKDLKEGEQILTERPLVYGSSYVTKPVLFAACIGCCKKIFPPSSSGCPQCKWLVCDANCRGLKRPPHGGLKCHVLTKIPSRSYCLEALLPFRCLLLQKSDPEKWKRIKEMATQVASLPAVYSYIRDELFSLNICRRDAFAFVELAVKIICLMDPALLPDCSAETVSEMFSLVDTYGLSLMVTGTGDMDGILKVSSLLQHSCVPNTRRVFSSPVDAETAADWAGRLTIRANKNIRRGEVLTTVITDQIQNTIDRQFELKKRRNYVCNCICCSDPHELGTELGTEMHTMPCWMAFAYGRPLFWKQL